MQVPIGMLIFWAHRFSDDEAVITGSWYYSEDYVPLTIDQKKRTIEDFKAKRCLPVQLFGTFPQICDLLMLSDKFNSGGSTHVKAFSALVDELSKEREAPYTFDDSSNLQGTALALDVLVDVDEDQKSLMEKINDRKNIVSLRISKDWSFAKDFIKYS